MEFTEHDKQYLEGLRKENPNRDIPSIEQIEDSLSDMEDDDEEVIGDLIIRIWDNEVEFELI